MRKLGVLLILLGVLLMIPLTTYGEDQIDDGKYTIYLHFQQIGSENGFYDKDYTPQKLSYNTGWSFTQKKLDNQVSYRNSFEYNEDKYTYSGHWAYSDGSTVTFPIRYNYTGEKEVHIYIHPVYDVEIVKHLTVKRINPLTGEASASNMNETSTYTHTFEQPITLDNYEFLCWDNSGETIQAGESKTWDIKSLPDKYNTVTYEAQYQPNVTVEWYVEDEMIDKESSFKAVSSAKACDETGFEGWLDEEGNEAAEEYVPNGINEEPTTVKLYAAISEPEPVVPVKPTNPTKPTKPSTPTVTPEETVVNTFTTSVAAPAKKFAKKRITTTTIEKQKTPKAAPEYWALFNLIAMLATILCLIRRKEGRSYNVFSILLPLISVGLFIFTEDIHNTMIMVDTWTILMALILGFEILARRLGKKTEDEEEIEYEN